IDTDSDIVQSEEEVEGDSGQQISDCDSNVSNEEASSSPIKPLEIEISGYKSDEPSDVMASGTRDCGEDRQRSVSQWARSAQAMLQTPQKVTEKQSKTPEDSAKKRRKFQRSEFIILKCILNKDIFSFHKQSLRVCVFAVDRPGVLVLEVQEVQEECSMRVVRCKLHLPLTEGHHDSQAPPEERTPLLVLFNKETAAQLNPLPKDIIHIYPPWLCVLVQDSYGMFSVVQLHLLGSRDDLQKYCEMWQGRTCLLRAIKVVQRVTRERHARLFGLIDSLWPPLVPVKHHGDSAHVQNVSPAPSFCYLLCGQETSIETSEDQSDSPLYVPPTKQTLKELLQVNFYFLLFIFNLYFWCQGEMWLALTDWSLQQQQQLEGPLRRTVTACVSSSCVLTSSVLAALNEPNAFIELCTLTTEPTVQSSLGSLGKPVQLDCLDLEVRPSTLCTVSGVIVDVDENTSYSWPACNHCGSDHLEIHRFLCVSCESILDKPETKVQLEVVLKSSLKDCTVKIKVLMCCVLQFPEYDVESVLGKELGPLNAYVRLITRKPSLWIGLEEISL
uniref:Scaffold protein involved in DNA repair n=1 Tax=Periophthalmus magnuspinnatus TaxID=409849 RepID=A0A3B3ZDW6_9GOBI